MKEKLRIKRSVFFCLMVAFFYVSCVEEPDCDLSEPYDQVRVKFYSKTDSSILFQKFFYLGARGTDSVFYSSEDSLSTFDLKLNPSADQVTYVFLTSTSSDTLTVSYTKQLQWLSEECGPSFFYEKLELIGSSFQNEFSTDIIDDSVNENIKIYN